MGLGFTANNEVEDNLIKNDFKSKAFFTNTNRRPSLMKSASLEGSLHVVVENNMEEVERYEEDYQSKMQPTKISVSVHNPVEPADLRTNNFEIPTVFACGLEKETQNEKQNKQTLNTNRKKTKNKKKKQ